MSQIKSSLAVLSFTAMLVLCGCGDKNSLVVFTPDSGGHPSGWTATHKTSAKTDLESCVECHGENLEGGISTVSCTKCHTAGPTSKHPVSWSDYTYARHAASYTAEQAAAPGKASSCANAACHGTSLGGVGNAPACKSCHIEGVLAKHPADWTVIKNGVLINPKDHAIYAKANGSDSCKNAKCHGNDAKGVFLSGLSCYVCHQVGPTGKHPAGDIDSTGHFNHIQYIKNNGVASCWTTICHGTSGGGVVGLGPSCSTSGCHK
jgi:hypothetical protein